MTAVLPNGALLSGSGQVASAYSPFDASWHGVCAVKGLRVVQVNLREEMNVDE
jgi:hypothetical protein